MEIGIVDDDIQIRKQILNFIVDFNTDNHILNCLISEFDSGETLLSKYVTNCDLDILFIDIEMKEINGIEAVKFLHKTNKNMIVIFITSHINYAEDMFRVCAFRLLLKPINSLSLKNDYLEAVQEYNEKNKRFAIKSQGVEILFLHKNIYYIESNNRHLYLFTENSSYEFASKISEVEIDLRSVDFVRCHKGYIVNMNYIKKINTSDIEIEKYPPLPLSKHRRADVLNQFSLFLRRR